MPSNLQLSAGASLTFSSPSLSPKMPPVNASSAWPNSEITKRTQSRLWDDSSLRTQPLNRLVVPELALQVRVKLLCTKPTVCSPKPRGFRFAAAFLQPPDHLWDAIVHLPVRFADHAHIELPPRSRMPSWMRIRSTTTRCPLPRNCQACGGSQGVRPRQRTLPQRLGDPLKIVQILGMRGRPFAQLEARSTGDGAERGNLRPSHFRVDEVARYRRDTSQSLIPESK